MELWGERLQPDLLSFFDEGCWLLDQVNADGLLVATGAEQADMVACWLTLRVLTPLQAALEREPPNEVGAHFDTFGLTAWEFPLGLLIASLSQRWQRDVLRQLLALPGSNRGVTTPFLEQYGQAKSPWPEEALVHFRVRGDTWARPGSNLIHTLRDEIDRAVAAEWERLNSLIARGEERLERASVAAQKALVAEVDAMLDGPGLGAAGSFLTELQETAQSRAARLEREAERCCARVRELDETADETGQVLDDLTGRFPPLRLRTLWGLLTHPWRLLHLWLLYREIGERAGVYLAYRQSQWLLQAEAGERKWQAAFYAQLAQAAGVEREGIAQLRARLEQLRGRLSPDPAQEKAMARRLEAATLPPELADYFYGRVTGDRGATVARLLAIYGPLSRWMREDWEIETLGHILAEHAQEQFAFLVEVRLDELLAHTYSEAELRRRLAALVDAATPWWACDESELSGEERARLRRLALVGLPDVDSSLLADLLPDRPLSCFSTGDRRQVITIQVMRGFRIRDQILEIGGLENVASDVDRSSDIGGWVGGPAPGVAPAGR